MHICLLLTSTEPLKGSEVFSTTECIVLGYSSCLSEFFSIQIQLAIPKSAIKGTDKDQQVEAC